MQETLVNALRARRPKVREHWEALLRTEPISTPLGHPDALVHLIDWTLDEIFTTLSNPLTRHRTARMRSASESRPECPCRRNPLLAYFVAAEQAMHEALVLAQAASAPLDPLERDASFHELNLILHSISRRELEAFCGVCQHRSATQPGPMAETLRFAEEVTMAPTILCRAKFD
jgi:hypothetical protein